MQNTVCKFMYLFVHLTFSKVIFHPKPPYISYSLTKKIQKLWFCLFFFFGGGRGRKTIFIVQKVLGLITTLGSRPNYPHFITINKETQEG